MNESTALQVQETAIAVQEKQLAAIRQILSQRTPDKEIRERKGRGGMVFKYTDGAYIIRSLNEALQHNWDFEADNEQIIEWQGVPFEVRCRGRLTLRMGGQAVTKVQYGSQLIEFVKDRSGQIVAPVSIGDCFKGAATDAMKKCASLFGLALDLYDSDFKAENYADDEPDAPIDDSDPRPKTLGELVTPKQLWMIRNMSKEQGINAHDVCVAKFGCALEEISKKAASAIIDQLKANQGAVEIEKKAIEMEAASRNAQAEKLRPAAKSDGAKANGPSRKAVFDRKHSPEIGARFDELVKQLTIRDIKPDEMLREANVALYDSGRKQIQTRYEADDESAAIVCNTFEAWIQLIDRKQQESRGENQNA